MRLLTGYFFSLLCIATPVSIDLANSQFCAAAGEKQQKLSFTDVYEPSTVIQLSDGLILIAEDEGSHPLLISRLIESENGLKLKPIRLKKNDSAFDDLEGSALGKDGAIYLITSHSLAQNDKRKKKRESLSRLTFNDGKISDDTAYGRLFSPINAALESESENGVDKFQQFNIEGLCFDSRKNKLLLGLRSPLSENKAIIMVLENPYALFSEGQVPSFQKKTIFLDIGGGGIRSIVYDSKRKTYLLANEIPNKKGKLKPAIWAWDGKPQSSPARVTLPKIKGMKNIEGMALVSFKKKTFLLLVSDDGTRKKKKGAHYYFLDTSSLAY
jgi:hypothetical protein